MFFTSIAARTDLGLVRQGNEDSALYHPKLIAVADGMGGAVGGEVASRIAITKLAERIEVLQSKDLDDESRVDLLQGVLAEIESGLSDEISRDRKLHGMGTTLTALMPLDGSIAMLHVGDSRAYRIRGGAISRLSHDHTIVQELVDQGKLHPDEIHDHPQRSMLTQALMGNGSKGSEFDLFPIQLFPLEKDDIYLVASDGLTAVLSDDLILKFVAGNSLEQAANNLIAATRDGGAPDNVTIILAKVVKSSDEVSSISFLGAAHE